MTSKFSSITIEELSLILNIKESTIKKLIQKNQIPHTTINRRPSFSLEKIFEYFDQIERSIVWI